ncbi:MAG TPA: protease HtpX [Candidatus Binatia bacterium]|jgi:heat shock protein HtpX|nr:protease HtpX [Candidatus Binatia bacterium]
MAKRIVLFLIVNVVVVLTISVLMSVLGVKPYLTQQGIDYQSLLIFCLIWGMGGSFISLALSRVMAKRMMGVQVISPDSREGVEQELLSTVGRLATGAGIPMPEVGVYESDDLNAFATGPSKSRSLVAVSSGLLRRMDRQQVDGVLGHEITHIANGDMVTMTLLQGVVNAFVMFLARVIAWGVAQATRRDDDEGISYGIFYGVQFALEIVFMVLGSMVVAAFSRYREFRADAGGAKLAGRESMIDALQALQRNAQVPDQAPASIAAFRIYNGQGIGRFFASHPPLEERISRLRAEG